MHLRIKVAHVSLHNILTDFNFNIYLNHSWNAFNEASRFDPPPTHILILEWDSHDLLSSNPKTHHLQFSSSSLFPYFYVFSLNPLFLPPLLQSEPNNSQDKFISNTFLVPIVF